MSGGGGAAKNKHCNHCLGCGGGESTRSVAGVQTPCVVWPARASPLSSWWRGVSSGIKPQSSLETDKRRELSEGLGGTRQGLTIAVEKLQPVMDPVVGLFAVGFLADGRRETEKRGASVKVCLDSTIEGSPSPFPLPRASLWASRRRGASAKGKEVAGIRAREDPRGRRAHT